MDGLLHALEASGGYAALTGIMMMMTFWLAKYVIEQQRQQTQQREELAAKRMAEYISRSEEALQRERESSLEHQHRTDKVISVVESNTKALTTLIVNNQMQAEVLLRIDRHFANMPVPVPKARANRLPPDKLWKEERDATLSTSLSAGA